jgi:hypothetical protein
MPSEFGGLMYDQALKGDQTVWWVFNDMGNEHTETGGNPIGLEVRAQAFALKNPQDVSYSTFYGYELINRSSSNLYEVHVGVFADVNIGYHLDDMIGSDVKRGLGYAYNGYLIDGSSPYFHYGANPPAVGIDFFQGPYMDPDGTDNPKYSMVNIGGEMVQVQNCDNSIHGQNFGNGVVDDERMGMQKFLHFYGDNSVQGVPNTAQEYYNYLRGLWRDGSSMLYGGNAHINSGAYGPECNYLFPGDSDPCNWGTGGLLPNGPVHWTEESVGNGPYDRRMLCSAGPFTLKAGAVNYITWGVPWARASTGGPEASVELLKYYDDKIQNLFDNCFRMIDGPDCPDIVARELDREIILFLSNRPNSNNYQFNYIGHDPLIVQRDGFVFDSLYRFEGFMVYQVKSADATFLDLKNPDKARLVAQCDVKNEITRIVNHYYDFETNSYSSVEEVNGANLGVASSFRILEDAFATGNDKRLVNNKKYYYTAIAYAHNEYEKYTTDPAYFFPGESSYYGQKTCFLTSSRNMSVITCIPQIPTPSNGGTILNSIYGMIPSITRIEGHGNGGNFLELTEESIDSIVLNWSMKTPTYKENSGPVCVKVVDPLNIKPGNYILKFDVTNLKIDSARWSLFLVDESDNVLYSWQSHKTIITENEQLLLELGLSVNIAQALAPGDLKHPSNGLISSEIVFADNANKWLAGVADIDGTSPYNWIRSGTTVDPNDPTLYDYDFPNFLDPDEHYEKIIGGTWAPYRLASRFTNGPAFSSAATQSLNRLENLYSVDIVFTPDKSKWSRCPVVETGEDAVLSVDNVSKLHIRKAPSVDKNGNPDGTGTGMGWFPGYAINVETGERLNVMFGESSWLAGENGNDMMFNPTSRYQTALGEIIWGGKHFLYVFGSLQSTTQELSPAYDEGEWVKEKLDNASNSSMRDVYQSVMWVSIPMLADGQTWLSNSVKISFRVSRPYKRHYGNSPLFTADTPQNDNWPLYRFSTHDFVADNDNSSIAESSLQLINIVPNPYYAHSEYEESVNERLVKIVNLPDQCTVSIFTVSGKLVRQFEKNEAYGIIEWDLKNQYGQLISGGMYLIHVNAPGIGERTLKWFGSMRMSMKSF